MKKISIKTSVNTSSYYSFYDHFYPSDTKGFGTTSDTKGEGVGPIPPLSHNPVDLGT